MTYYTNAHYQIVYDYRVQTVWDELIKLSGLPTLLFYVFKFCMNQYQLHIADIDMVEDIERMGKRKKKGSKPGSHEGGRNSAEAHEKEKQLKALGSSVTGRNRSISQMYEHGHFNFLKMYLLQDN